MALRSLKSSINYFSNLRNLPKVNQRFLSTHEINSHRSELFSYEKERQEEKIGRIEKMEVRYMGLPNDTTLVMNKGLSTPYNCAQHLSEMHCTRSALALIDSNIPWDMHRPLNDSCTIQLLNFTIADPHIVNRAFWRTCSFLMGAALQECFKEEANLFLNSFPSPNVKSGSFVYDIALSHHDWQPNAKELRTIAAEMVKIAARNVKIERLDVDHDLAVQMFKDNPFKREQLPSISGQSNGKITVYRVGDHIDISRGPMVGGTGFLGKCSITAAHKILKLNDNCSLYRVQGVALPTGFTMNHFAFEILTERAKKMNSARLPHEPYDTTVEAAVA